jgi:transcriptional regulator with XRE-family HTH domain
MSPRAYAVETGKQFCEMRKAAGMKQAEVAAELEVAVSSVSNWERGSVSISDYDARRLRKLYRRKQAATMKALQEVAR